MYSDGATAARDQVLKHLAAVPDISDDRAAVSGLASADRAIAAADRAVVAAERSSIACILAAAAADRAATTTAVGSPRSPRKLNLYRRSKPVLRE